MRKVLTSTGVNRTLYYINCAIALAIIVLIALYLFGNDDIVI